MVVELVGEAAGRQKVRPGPAPLLVVWAGPLLVVLEEKHLKKLALGGRLYSDSARAPLVARQGVLPAREAGRQWSGQALFHE